mmetsp:Transcript_32234/g.55681  ORF Transcript_32234/g.55681 Transcript_32234/m.55681 type:complete len:197 (+) Transcript_32234:34-624(+)
MRMEKKNQPVYNYNNAACSMALSKAEHDLIDDILLGAEEKSSSSESFFSIDDHAFVDSVLLPPTTQSPVISDSLDDVDNELHKMDSPLEQAAPDRTIVFFLPSGFIRKHWFHMKHPRSSTSLAAVTMTCTSNFAARSMCGVWLGKKGAKFMTTAETKSAAVVNAKNECQILFLILRGSCLETTKIFLSQSIMSRER